MVTIGHVTLPSTWVVQRANDGINPVIGTVEVDTDYDTAYHITNNLPDIRYTGFMKTADNVAILKLDALVEMFINPDIRYPLFIDVDEEFYFLLNSFSYSKPPGYIRFWRFELDVKWLGTAEVLKNIYINETFTKTDNSWDI